jgi:predicted small secreted protein
MIYAKEAALAAKNYFEEIKSHSYFLFETSKVEHMDNHWIIQCEVKNVFENETRKYEVIVSDESGDIVDVSRID